MRLTTALKISMVAAIGSGYIIAAPIYAVKRNLEGKPREKLAREEHLRRRLQPGSRFQKVIYDELSSFRDVGGKHSLLDLCDSSDCGLIKNPTTLTHSHRSGDEDRPQNDFHEKDSYEMPSWDVDELSQITELAIGTPPQKIRVIVSISDSDLFIPSSNCGWSCEGHATYNSSLSRTYQKSGRIGRGEFWRIPSEHGPISQDTLHIAGLEVERQAFVEGTDVSYLGEELANDVGWDGYLGLSRDNNGSRSGIANVFQNLISGGRLDRNIFSLKFSRGPHDPGELMFGGINHGLHTGDFKTLRTINDTEPIRKALPGRWSVPITGIRIGERSVDYEGYVALLESDMPIIMLPEQDSVMLNQHLGMESTDGVLFSTNCARRSELEDIVLTLGTHDFVIGSYEYTLKMYLKDYDGVRCVSAFAGIHGYYPTEKFVILGSAFLKNFYSVFDPEAGTVSLGKLAAPAEQIGSDHS